MTLKTAKQLQKRIEADAPSCHVNGLVEYAVDSYALTVTDTRTGVQFTVASPEAWAERQADASLDWSQYA